MASQTITVDTEEGSFGAYINRPADQSARSPALIVLQEIFGVNAFVREVCDRFAAEGYIAAAPDLFWRQQPGVDLGEHERERGMAFMQGLDEDMAVSDTAALMSALRTLPGCSGKVGAVGYCLGGKIAFLLASQEPVDAAVSYYGVGIQNALAYAPSIAVPLLLHIGAEDALCPPPAQASIEKAMAGRSNVELVTHAAGHAFARTGSAAYVEDCARAADAQTRSFLAKHL